MEDKLWVEFCILYNCPISEADCDRKREYGCAGCTELREVPPETAERWKKYWF